VTRLAFVVHRAAPEVSMAKKSKDGGSSGSKQTGKGKRAGR
jgi:hypothetical protein